MFSKIRQKFEQAVDQKHDQGVPVTIPRGTEISKRDIYRNRYNRGVNLGGCFVLEKWIYDTVFDKGGDNEFDAVTSQIKGSSTDEAAQKLNNHYKDYIGKIDWAWLKNEAEITALRVPIGYWHVDNGSYVDGFPFESLKEVYMKARPWDALKELIKKAGENEIGVLVDMHGLPGGANTDAHSGYHNESPSFFQVSKYVDKMANDVLPFVAKDVCTNNENVIGLQLVNEAVFDNHANGQKKYYSEAIRAIHAVDEGLPLIISDGWWPQQWSEWLKQENLDTGVVIDSHIYRCFSDEDKSKTANQIIDDLSKSVNLPKDQADYMVGEFSCVLDGQTWGKSEGNRAEFVKKYGITEVAAFSHVASWGWFFWTLQFKYGDGGEWGLVPMIKNGAIPRRSQNAYSAPDDGKIKDLVNEHVNYWNDKGGDKMEHWRFEDGLRSSITDIEAFSKFDNSRLGRWHSWTAQRRSQYVNEKSDGEYMWEWDQGYQRGLEEFNQGNC